MLTSLLSSIYSITISLIGITGIIVFHEFGHFIFCKLFNIYTPTFSIGMGKIIYSKKIGQTNFCLSAAPIGGYVEIATEKGIHGTNGFDQVPYYQKCLIMLGGILCNFLLTFLIFAGLFFTGMPESGIPYETNKTSIQAISESSINKHNLQALDIITSINEKSVDNNASIIKQEISIRLNNNIKDIPATIKRNGETQNILLNINSEAKPQTLNNLLDVQFEKKPPLSLIGSIHQAYITTTFCLNSIITGLKGIFSSQTAKGFVGPIMAVAISSKSAKKGLSSLLLLLAIISINLGFMNLLPLPIFDGGQFVIFTIEAISRRKLSEKVRNAIGISSWILALGLLVVFSLRDLHTLIFG